MLLRSLEIKNFRSLENVHLDKLELFNVLIGRNNVGKSSIFGALKFLVDSFQKSQGSSNIITAKDKSRTLEICLVFCPNTKDREEFIDLLIEAGHPSVRRDALINSPLLRQIKFVFKTRRGEPDPLNLYETHLQAEDGKWAIVQKLLPGHEHITRPVNSVSLLGLAGSLGSLLNSEALDLSHSAKMDINIESSFEFFRSRWITNDNVTHWPQLQLTKFLSTAFFFNSFRHSTQSLPFTGAYSLAQDGSNLAQVLCTLILNDRPKFDEVERFLQMAIPDIGKLQTPPQKDSNEIRVAFNSLEGYQAYLQETGGGVEQLLIIATLLLTTNDEYTLFLEEPENHLHAGAQRFLLEKLYGTGRQTFITTHSPTFINLSRPFNLYQVTNVTGRTSISLNISNSMYPVLEDIGIRNSDVLLSDAVLFVEGPGDKEVINIFSEKIGFSLAERNINVLTMGGGQYAEKGAPIRNELLANISQGAPIKHLFLLDRDERTLDEINNLEARLGDQVYFFKARELENYLLKPRAILSALRTKHHSNDTILEMLDDVSEEQVRQLIQSTAQNLYNTVLVKRIRSKLKGLRDGLLPRNLLPDLIKKAHTAEFPDLVSQTIKSQLEEHIKNLDIVTIVQHEKRDLDELWIDNGQHCFLAPGEEILDVVFRQFGSQYNKPQDTVRIAEQMYKEDIDNELEDVIKKAYYLNGT